MQVDGCFHSMAMAVEEAAASAAVQQRQASVGGVDPSSLVSPNPQLFAFGNITPVTAQGKEKPTKLSVTEHLATAVLLNEQQLRKNCLSCC